MAENEVSNNDEKDTPQPKGVSRRQFITRVAAGAGAIAATTVLEACGGSGSTPLSSLNSENLSSTAWRFGVMADTQWTTPDDNYNPNTSAVSIARQIQQQFINAGVKLVLHVGDLCDNGSTAGEDTRALFAQPLYNAGIGFFPIRGNHDDQAGDGAEFQRIYPQTGAVPANAGIHNSTPSDVLAMTNPDATNQPSPTKSGSTFTVGTNFSSPTAYSGGLTGLSYAFDCSNVRFIMLDQFTPTTCPANPTTTADGLTWDAGLGSGSPTTINNQQSWINSMLSGRPATSHAFVFSHKGLITCQHADNLLSTSGGGPADNQTYRNAFISSLATGGGSSSTKPPAGFYINGHDHLYDRALITSPDGTSTVMSLLAASNSTKFYVPAGSGNNYSGGTGATTPVPKGSTNDIYYNGLASLPSLRTPVTQDLYTAGYYIFTVDGANVTVDYYTADVNLYQATNDPTELLVNTANGLNFIKRESFGYGLNGKRFMVAQGASYATGAIQITHPTNSTATGVSDTSVNGTKASILYGTNSSTVVDACQQKCVKVVTTGWTPATNGSFGDILALWGIDPYQGSTQTDTFVLYMKPGSGTMNTRYAIASLDSNGHWTNAVNNNSAGTKTFVNGAWSNAYTTPGTYGYNAADNSVWAVLNYTGVFAIVPNVS